MDPWPRDPARGLTSIKNKRNETLEIELLNIGDFYLNNAPKF